MQFMHADEEKEKKSYSSSTSFSLLMISGNTQELTLGFETEQNLEFKKNHIQFKGNIIYSENEDSKDSEVYSSHLQYKRRLSSKAHILGLSQFERNVPSGYKYRFALSGGAGYLWIRSKKIELFSEAICGWSQERNIKAAGDGDISLSFVSIQISTQLKLSVSATSELTYQEIFFFNLDNTKDYRISSNASISVNISRYLALKLSYQFKYNHLPVPGFRNTDHYLLSSLVLNL